MTPPCDCSAWAPSDVATVIIAVVAVMVSASSVLATWLVHHYQGAVVSVVVRFSPELWKKSTYEINTDREPDVTALVDLKGAGKLLATYPTTEYYYFTKLRVVVTNKGRTDAFVDSITFANSSGEGRGIRHKDDPEYPLRVGAGTYVTKDDAYSEPLDFALQDRKIRYVAQLTNGKKIKSKWIKVTPDLRNPRSD